MSTAPLAVVQAGDAVIAGSHNLAAPVEMQVERVGGDTRYAQIVVLMEQASVSKPQVAWPTRRAQPMQSCTARWPVAVSIRPS